jgi:fructose-bisphosphate aldolase class II
MPYHRGAELSRVYDRAKRRGYGFVASNVTHPDVLVGLLAGAEAVESDAVLQVKRDTAAYFGRGDPRAGLHLVGEWVRTLGEGLDAGAFLNVDHVDAGDEAFLSAVLETGVASSVMVDASDRPFEENVARTRAARERIDESGGDLLLEAELGTVAGTESGVDTTEAHYTDPEEAVEFVERTGCDLLAVSVGTEHGVSKGADLELRPSVARDVDDALRAHGLDLPLVVHGSSGLSPGQVTELLSTGVCKLNTNTRYQYEYARTALEFYREHESAIRPPEGVDDDRTTFFSGADWSPEKAVFDPRVVGRRVRERIATVMGEVAGTAGSAGESVYA